MSQDLFEQAKNIHRAGDPIRASALYQQVLRAEPSHAGAWYLLGVAAQGLGKLDEAEESLRNAVQLSPTHAEVRNHLGVVYTQRGKWAEAIGCFRDVIRIRPDFAAARQNLELALKTPAVQAEAASQNTHGLAFKDQGRLDEAHACFQRAIDLKPEFAQAHRNLGIVLGRRGQVQEAVASFQTALRLEPEFAEAHHALGAAYHFLGRWKDALACYREALRLRPGYAETYSNLGDILVKEGDLDEAVSCYQQAIRLMPKFAGVHNNLGNALSELGRLTEAAASFRQAMRLAPREGDAASNLLKCLNYDPEIDRAALYAEHCRWGQVYGSAKVIGPRPDHDRDPERPLRVGYVSPDFRTHAVAGFLEPILANHDRRVVESFAYAEVLAPDAVTARLQSLVSGWRSTPQLTDDQLAELIRQDRIDILVDLAGHTANHRLGVFARRPAPIQATYLGYPNTTGLTTVDYLLTDEVVDPPGEPRWSTETPYRLPGVFCCYAPAASAPEVNALPASHNDRVTFASLHKLSKLNPGVLDLWCELLRAVPAARLLLFRNNLQGHRRAEIVRYMTAKGVDANRVELREKVEGGGGFLRVYHDVDISLDVFPWCGHTTACESLWMGVSVITLSGDRHAGRMTASVVRGLGMNDWVADSPEAYAEIARRGAADRESLARLRSELRPRMQASPLCDGRTWTRNLEAAYREMWRTWCSTGNSAQRT